MHRLLTVLLLSCIAGSRPAGAQVSSAPVPSTSATPNAPVYTLHTGTQMVVTDVSVTDQQGKPVHGLDRSAFRVFDNGRAQPLAMFEEHAGAPEFDPTTAPAPQVYSNVYRLHPPAASNVLFIDSTRLGMLDQMYLAAQLTRFIQALPKAQFLAVYSRSGVKLKLLQDFTSDHELLTTAIAKAVPLLPSTDAIYSNDLTALSQLEDALKDLPGRKNVLWFSAGSNSPLLADAALLATGMNLKQVYDELAASRIAVYPVDARGLLVTTPTVYQEQLIAMENVAEATGGKAFYYTNGFAQIASRVVDGGSSFYTLSYSLHNPKLDNKWHKVAVEVEGSRYTLSYRRGYFDDGSIGTKEDQNASNSGKRKLLTREGDVTPLPDPEASRKPLIFYASVERSTLAVPQANAGQPATGLLHEGGTTYSIKFHLPASEFVHGQSEVVVKTGVLACNRLGESIGQLQRQVTVRVDQGKLLAHPDGFLSFEQQINLLKGEDYLDLAVIEPASGRIGMIHVPVEVEHAKR